MRIGIITGEYPPMQGGVGAYTQILAQTLHQQGHAVFVYSSAQAQQTDNGIHVMASAKNWRWGTLRRINQWIQENQIDVISLQYETAAFAMSPWIHLLPAYLSETPIVTTFHDLLPPYLFPKAGALRDWIVMHLARSSAGVIATNHEDMERLQALPVSQLIPIGSNILTALPDDFDRAAWREKAGTDHREILLAHFGFLNHSKGLETLLIALAELVLENFPVKLVMVGGRTGASDHTNAAYATHIDEMIEQLGIVPYVHWTGFVNDTEVAAYLKASDAVVLPYLDGASYRRGSLMAAIQHGCPIITTQPKVDIPTFRHGENMLYFPPGDVRALVSLIREIKQDKQLTQRVSEGALALRSHFQWEQIAQDYAVSFRIVLQREKSLSP